MSKVYGIEDLYSLTENVEDSQKGVLTKLMMDMMQHEAYNNPRQVDVNVIVFLDCSWMLKLA